MATISSSPRKCKLDSNVFCYICGSFTVSEQRQRITDFVKKANLAYFGVKLGDQDKNWAPHQVCRICAENLTEWTRQKKTIRFAVPMVWREQANHVEDCYFCMTNVAGFSSKSKGNIKYPNLPSAITPIPHSAELPPPLFTSLPEVVDEPESSTTERSSLEDDGYEPLADYRSPILITQAFLNDLIRDLNLPKESAELLGSRLQHNNLLAPNTTYSWYRRREKGLVQYFPWKKHLYIVTMLLVFFKRWAVHMTQQNGYFLLTVVKPV